MAIPIAAADLLLYALRPDLLHELYREGQAVEQLTALAYLAAAAIAAVTLLRARPPLARPYWLVAVLAGTGFLEELSWGLFDLGIRPPRLLGERIDALHDLPELALRLLRDSAPGWLVALVVLAVLAAVAGLARRHHRALAAALAASWTPRFAIGAVVLVLAGQAADVGMVAPTATRFHKVLEELLELEGALAMLFAALAMPRLQSRRASLDSDGA